MSLQTDLRKTANQSEFIQANLFNISIQRVSEPGDQKNQILLSPKLHATENLLHVYDQEMLTFLFF